VRRGFDWLFRSRDNGRITIAQWPNFMLWVVILCDAGAALWHPGGTVGGVVHWTGRAAIVLWSLDEIVRGANPFRRMLGAGILASTLIAIAF
jgi:hypothetical protein